MALPIYFTGTVSVAAGGTVVTLTGGMWSGINAKQGDFISINNSDGILITEVTDATHIKIPPWQGAAQTNVNYVIFQNYVGRVVGVAAAEDVGDMLEKLHVDGLPFIVGSDEAVPDPSYGDDGQMAFKPTTGEWWVKDGGAWVPSAGLSGSGDVTGPASSVADRIAVFNGTSGKVIKDGGKTIAEILAAGGSNVSTTSTPPPGAVDGDLWWEDDTGALYVYYTDATPNSQWVQIPGSGGSSGGGGGGGAPPSTSLPAMDGVANAGIGTPYAREDHVHPTDTSRAASVHSHVAANISDFSEAVDDRVGSLLVAGANITLDYDDSANTLSITSTASGGGAGSGDVTGPVSAVADRIAVFNGTSGKVIKDGGSTLAVLSQLAPLDSPTFTGDPRAPTPLVGDNDTSIATTAFVTAAVSTAGAVRYDTAQTLTDIQKAQARTNMGEVLRGYIAGLTLSTAGSSATFGIAAGVAADSTAAAMMTLASAYTKTTAAWALGTGVGALDTGTITALAWYHVFLIRRPDTGVVDVLISLSPTAPTLPASYTQFRRIGSLKTVSSQWVKFFQDGDNFQWDTASLDVNAANPGTAAVTRTLSVPLGIRTQADIAAVVVATAATDTAISFLISDLGVTDVASGVGTNVSFGAYSTATGTSSMGGKMQVWTNTASQVRSRLQASAAGTTLVILTQGWRDPRGKDA